MDKEEGWNNKEMRKRRIKKRIEKIVESNNVLLKYFKKWISISRFGERRIMKTGAKTSVIVRRKINVEKRVTNIAVKEEGKKIISTKVMHITNRNKIKKEEGKILP